ncbi:hypothetical protein CPB85DRAFT_1432226 [Mucidula mucida]|nr:hypothetical protein CPB85DRAFT_1432226 [Mucidula mucida]
MLGCHLPNILLTSPQEGGVPLERAVSAALKPLIGHVQDTNCHLQELFALGPMLQTVPSDVPICNERLAQLLAEAFAEPSESSNVQRAILNPDESVTESEASDGEDCDKFDSLLRLLSVPEAGRTKQWAFERLALFSKLETLMAKERVDDVWADNTLPAALTNAIDVKAAELFLSSDLSAYKEWPNKKLMTQLAADGNIPAGVSRDKAANKLIGRYIGSKFIHYRNDTKDLIGQSMGIFNDTLKKFDGPSWGIYELTEKIIDTVTSTGVVVSITLPFVARVAFLRYLYAAKLDESMNGKVPSDFWDCIDAKLVKIREEKKDAAKITKVFQHALTKDRHRFGDAAATVSINAFMLSAEAQGNRVAAAPAPVAGPSSSS